MITYSDGVKKLEEAKCKPCDGSGRYDDAPPGAAVSNEHECPGCNGCGFDLGKVVKLREIYQDARNSIIDVIVEVLKHERR